MTPIMVVLALIAAEPPSGCGVPEPEANAQMELSYDAFDGRGGPAGWRSLNGRGCTDAAVTLLRRYRLENAARLTGEQAREMAFHIGQALAFAGRNDEAIPHFEQADGAGATAEWRAYVRATLAFLRRDHAALVQSRDAYAVAAGADPMRLRVIDGFIACPERSYTESVHCAM